MNNGASVVEVGVRSNSAGAGGSPADSSATTDLLALASCPLAFFSQSRQSRRPSETGNPQVSHLRRLATSPRDATTGVSGEISSAFLASMTSAGSPGAGLFAVQGYLAGWNPLRVGSLVSGRISSFAENFGLATAGFGGSAAISRMSPSSALGAVSGGFSGW